LKIRKLPLTAVAVAQPDSGNISHLVLVCNENLLTYKNKIKRLQRDSVQLNDLANVIASFLAMTKSVKLLYKPFVIFVKQQLFTH